jgi:(1->4)-alpha-D-glucan 1-alpha-D-glucosylmutase
MTGVPDVYQGSEAEFLALTDPDNRRAVECSRLRALVEQGETAESAADLAQTPAVKPFVVGRALRLRREHPEWFSGDAATQTPLFPVGAAADHAVAFLRGEHVAVVGTRLPVGLERNGGWGDTTLSLPPGSWRCRLSGRLFEIDRQSGAGVPLVQLTAQLPVALLVRQEAG